MADREPDAGAGDAQVQLTVQRNAPSRSKADLNIETDPSFAAPSVESGPLQLTVCVERCP
jgi:hypothetical protein